MSQVQDPKRIQEVGSALAETIDRYRNSHPELTVLETLSALEGIRYRLTEAWINVINPPTRSNTP